MYAAGIVLTGAALWRAGLWLQDGWRGFFDERRHPVCSAVEQIGYASILMSGVVLVVGGLLGSLMETFCRCPG